MSGLLGAILCDCSGRYYCNPNSKCTSYMGNHTYDVWDCKTGTSCGSTVVFRCSCTVGKPI
ncbi:Uncharacterised protein [Streptococcus pneumoniae]|uniref:Uncharacterized protein n=1 Tax=Bacillus mobilis TaxID=2026190 RepID=A0A1Y6AQG6_9BACI|nr:hypothetical protein BG06_4795 [Bacillus thuringiensis]PRP93351.1 hypothetical protein TUN_46260 [Bacillus sp. M21]COF37931.1 Uncharacterised protein [Streptococcus pneumoniae]SME43880.1 hypothetical protein BACERE00185_04909 [Bacillus mobilis]